MAYKGLSLTIAPEPTTTDFSVLPELVPYVHEASKETGLEPNLIKAMIEHESGGGRNLQAATSSAYGPMQIIAGTAESLGINRYDSRENIIGGSKYLKQQLDTFGDVEKALAAYFKGPGEVEKYGKDVPGTTGGRTADSYISDILRRKQRLDEQSKKKYNTLALTIAPEEAKPTDVPQRPELDIPQITEETIKPDVAMPETTRTTEAEPEKPSPIDEVSGIRQELFDRGKLWDSRFKVHPQMEEQLNKAMTKEDRTALNYYRFEKVASPIRTTIDIGNQIVLTLATGAGIGALPKYAKALSAAKAIQNAPIRVAAVKGVQAFQRAVASGGVSAVKNLSGVVTGQMDLKNALINTGETAAAAVASVLPEGVSRLLPTGTKIASEVLSQIGAGATFNYFADKALGREYEDSEKVNIAGIEIPTRYIIEGAIDAGFAFMDVNTKEFVRQPKPTQQIKVVTTGKLADMLMAPTVPVKPQEMSAEPTEFETAWKKDVGLVDPKTGEHVPNIVDAAKGEPGAFPIQSTRRRPATETQLKTIEKEEARKVQTEIAEMTGDKPEEVLAAKVQVEQKPKGRPPLMAEGQRGVEGEAQLFKTGQKKEILDNETGSISLALPEKKPLPTGEIPKKPASKLANLSKEWFTSEGLLPEKVYQLKVLRDGQINNYMRDIDKTVSSFYAAAKKTYGKARLSDEDAFNIDLVLKNQKPVDELSEPLRPIMRKMRTEIDALSQRYIDEGLVQGDLAVAIGDNMGMYANRSYRVFNEPDWAKKVPGEVKNNAKAFLRQDVSERYNEAAENVLVRLNSLSGKKAQLQAEERVAPMDVGDKIKEIDNRISELNKTLESVQKKAQPSEDEIDGMIDNLLYKEGAPVSVLASGSKLGSKNLSMLKRRKEIPPQIRALWGEYKNADVNYANSVYKMASALANHKFLNQALEVGKGDFFFDEPIVKNGESYSVKLAADASSAMAPLNGKYTTPEIKRAFEEISQHEVLPGYLRLIMKGIGTTKYAKTIGSVMTHLRNVTGNVGFAIANGHWRVKNLPTAFSATFGDVLNMQPKQLEAEIKDLIGRGVLSDGVRAGELHGIIKDATQGNIDILVGTGAKKNIQRGLRFAEKLYGAEDDVWKWYAFKNEYARYKEAYPEMPEDALRQKVATIVRNTYPTYSMVPKMIQKLRRFPFVGTFVSFPAEVVRTGKNTIGLAAEELKNPQTKKIGAERLAGILTAATLPTVAALASRFLTGTTSKREKAMRKFLPPWSENSHIVHTGEGGQLTGSYIDLGYSDPHSYLRDPVMALIRGEDWQSKLYESTAEIFRPFLSEDIFYQKITDLQRNKQLDGQPVYNPSDKPENIASDIAAHFAESFEPGTISGMRRMYKAATGQEGKSGTPYDFKTEAIAQATGVRVSKMDVPRSLGYKAYKFNKELSDVRRLARKRGADVSGEQMKVLFDNFYKTIDAAYVMGMPRLQIAGKLMEANIPRDMAVALALGNYEDYIAKATLRKKIALMREQPE